MIRFVWVVSHNLMHFFQHDEFSGIYSFSNRHSLAVGQIVWKQSEKYPLIFTAIVIYGKLKKQNKFDRHDCWCHILIRRLSSDLSVSVGRKVWNVGVIYREQIICLKDTLEPDKQNSKNWFLTKLELSIRVWMLVQCHNNHKKRDLLWSIVCGGSIADKQGWLVLSAINYQQELFLQHKSTNIRPDQKEGFLISIHFYWTRVRSLAMLVTRHSLTKSGFQGQKTMATKISHKV